MIVPKFAINLDAILVDNQAGRRQHNAVMKEVMREELEHHWRKRIPLHFGPGAASRYNYMNRSAKYVAWKRRRFGAVGALLKTGASQRLMRSQHRIAVGGAAEGGKNGLRGRLFLRFSWDAIVAAHMRRKHFRPGMSASQRARAALAVRTKTGVNLEQMKKELQTIRDDEAKQIAESMKRSYTHKINMGRGLKTRKTI